MHLFEIIAMKSLSPLLSLAIALTSVHFVIDDAQGQIAAQSQVVERADEKFASFRLNTKHLPNAIQIHDRVISGGQPDGEPGFRELSEFGVKTIISVDGAKPQVEIARQFGLRYVHLPHGYNGIEQERVKELAKAVRDLDGPIYIHCHHGKHRSAAAAVVACVSAGLIETVSASAILKLAGTSENYRGLFESVETAKRLPDTALDAIHPEFPESAKLLPMARAMVELENTHDHLKQLAASGWKPVQDHPALDLAHEALLLREHFSELIRMESGTVRTEVFRKLLMESESDAKLFEQSIRRMKLQRDDSPSGPSRVSESLARINANCVNCHRQFRDLPIGKAN